MSGVVNYTARNDEATFNVKYTGATNYEVTLRVLDTDYDSFAVVWSCNSLAGPVGHTGIEPHTYSLIVIVDENCLNILNFAYYRIGLDFDS